MKPSAGPNDVKVRLTEKFWRRFGAPINEKTAQLVVFTTHYADFGGEGGIEALPFPSACRRGHCKDGETHSLTAVCSFLYKPFAGASS